MNEWSRVQDLHENWGRVQDVFFDAMVVGYATEESGRPSFHEKRGGTKRKQFIQGHWSVIDEWLTTSTSDYSEGTTVIFYDGKLVWMMQYFGYYKPRAISVLKASLRQEYIDRSFQGGRGPSIFTHDDGEYTNTFRGDFHSFSGKETVTLKNDVGGYHVYHGGLMIRTP